MHLKVHFVCCKNMNTPLLLSAGSLSATREVVNLDGTRSTSSGFTLGLQSLRISQDPKRRNASADSLYLNALLLYFVFAGFLSATGEVVTFDGASFTFSGVTGVYKVLEDPSDGMYVQAHFVYCEYGSCVDAVGVRMSNIKVTVYAPPRAYALPKVKIDGTEISITGICFSLFFVFFVVKQY